jgi:dipeptidyl aminopeptidase/acylaminoacyl peptidase
MVGWSFGGYAALLGATRNSDLFRCSVSIAGVSDLSLYLQEEANFANRAIVREQVGTNYNKLREDSPRRHADKVQIPLLMIHGDRDANVNFEQSEAMAKALKNAHKPFEFIRLKDADRYIALKTDRLTLLNAIEKFLLTNLGAGATPPP